MTQGQGYQLEKSLTHYHLSTNTSPQGWYLKHEQMNTHSDPLKVVG